VYLRFQNSAILLTCPLEELGEILNSVEDVVV